MSLTILCTVVVVFYIIIWFFDSFFRSCMHYPYYAFLEGTGLRVGIFNFSWTTTAFNRSIYRWSKNLSKVLRRWFTFGYIVTVGLFLPFALWTVASFVLEHFHDKIQMSNVPEIKAIVPGVNIPASDFGVYFIAIAFSSITHELGHAMAAAHEDVQLISVGMFVFAIIPLAFVQLNTENLNSIEIKKRLGIYCAGVWHNIAVAFFALLFYFSSPIFLSLGYHTDLGVRVTGFTDNSPLKEVRGLSTGNIITSINKCEIKNIKDWNHCLYQAYEHFGICTTAEFVAQHDEILMEKIKDNNMVECCRPEDIYSFCFEYMEPKEAAEDSALPGQFSCLKPRDMVINSFDKCTQAKGYMCPREKHCLKPFLNNHTYFIIIERKDDPPVLYLGLPVDVHRTVFVDYYIPRSTFFSFFSPMQFEKLLQYIFIFSLGIGFLNVIPCFGTDGHHIARTLAQIMAKRFNKNEEFVTVVTLVTVIAGTLITVPMLTYLFYKAVTEGE